MDSIVGITKKDWKNLLKQNHYKVSVKYMLKALIITNMSRINSKDKKREDELFGAEIKNTRIEKAPLFILGHWRSGTTFLQNILINDNQFISPNLFECRNPHTFLVRQKMFEFKLKRQKEETRITDNVKLSLDSPGEEEFAVGIMSLCTPLLGWLFPAQRDYYERFLTFEQASKEELDRWKYWFLYYLKKITFKHNKQLLLKSPVNTARVKYILDVFPDAKFVHIHRNPYAVFRSSKKMFHTAFSTSALQKNGSFADDDYVIDHYSRMHDAYFRDIKAIPEGNFIDLAFEDLERDPFAEVKKIYTALNLAGFEDAGEAIKQYLDSLKGYQKNTYKELDEDLRRKIQTHWKRSFETWAYDQ